jgi:hypothetical protein
MAVHVYVWEMFKDQDGNDETFAGCVGGFGHVAAKVRDMYLSWWPAEFEDESGSFSYSYEEDKARCRRAADSIITIDNLNEGQMLKYWEKWTAARFNSWTNNCCTVISRLLNVGQNLSLFSSIETPFKRYWRGLTSLPESVKVAFNNDFRELLGGVHDPQQVKQLATYLSRLTK